MLILIVATISFLLPLLGPLQPYASEDLRFNAAQQLAVAASVVLACLLLDRRKLSSLGVRFNRRWWKDLAAGLLMGAGMMTLIFLIEYRMGWITLGANDASWSTLLPTLFGWLLLFISVGVVEEVLSRGYHLKNITEGFSGLGKTPAFLIATFISSAIFGLLHAMNPNADLVSMVNICLAGVMFCIGRLSTGSLAAPMGLHITWNFFQGPVFGFAVSGNETAGSIFKATSTTNALWTGGEFGPEAGLMGVFAILIMSAIYWCWPRDRSSNRVQPAHQTGTSGAGRIELNLAQLADFEHRRNSPAS